MHCEAVSGLKSSLRGILESGCPRTMLRYRMLFKLGYEPEMDLLPSLCHPGKTSLDIGANIGMFTSRLFPHSRSVIAFEPNPYLAGLLRNSFDETVKVEQLALSCTNGVKQLTFPSGQHALGSIQSEKFHNLDMDSYEVKTCRLDDLEIPHTGFIKIDVEGHELDVLEGSVNTLVQDKPVLLIEIEERHKPGAIRKVNCLLKNLGYKGKFFSDGKLNCISKFIPERHQNPRNISETGQRTGPYINNFLFFAV